MSQGTIRRSDNLSKAFMLQMEHQIKPRWHSLAGAGIMVCTLVNFPTNEVIAEGRGNDHEESFDAAYKAWTEAAAAAKTVALENEGLRERLRDLEQQVEKSTAPVHSETQSEDPAPATAPAPKRRRSGVKKSTTTQPDF